MPKQALGTLAVAFGLHFVILVIQVERTLEAQSRARALDILLVVASDLHFVTLALHVEQKQIQEL
jgi:hypothetical protein